MEMLQTRKVRVIQKATLFVVGAFILSLVLSGCGKAAEKTDPENVRGTGSHAQQIKKATDGDE